MAGDQQEEQDSKTEAPTPRRLEQSREKGEIAFSRDVMGFVSLVAGVVAVYIVAEFAVEEMSRLFRLLMEHAARGPRPGGILDVDIFPAAMWTFAKLIAIPGGLGMLGLIAAGVSQTRFNLSLEPMKPAFKKMNPLPKMKQMFFSANTGVELAKSLAKLIAMGYVGWTVLAGQSVWLMRMPHLSLTQNMEIANAVFIKLCVAMGIALMLIAVLDCAWQQYSHTKKMRMTKNEIRDEFKETEGDPLIMGQRKQKMRELAQLRATVKLASDATVVIVNPTHVAVALRYDPSKESAPRVLCKGADQIAAEIRAVARKAGVPIIQRRELARLMYKTCKTGGTIPIEIFEAVAAVLALVISRKNRNQESRREGAGPML